MSSKRKLLGLSSVWCTSQHSFYSVTGNLCRSQQVLFSLWSEWAYPAKSLKYFIDFIQLQPHFTNASLSLISSCASISQSSQTLILSIYFKQALGINSFSFIHNKPLLTTKGWLIKPGWLWWIFKMELLGLPLITF